MLTLKHSRPEVGNVLVAFDRDQLIGDVLNGERDWHRTVQTQLVDILEITVVRRETFGEEIIVLHSLIAEVRQ